PPGAREGDRAPRRERGPVHRRGQLRDRGVRRRLGVSGASPRNGPAATGGQMRTVVIALALVACSKGGGGNEKGGRGSGGQKLQYPVDVATLESKQVVYSVNAPGTIDAFQQVQITARVAGAVDKVTFVEGQAVKAGDVLALIESERYLIAVDQ